MNYLDIIILIPVVWGIYKGFKRGLVVEIASLLALILGVWCAIHFSELTADILVERFKFNISDTYMPPVSFAVTFIIVAVAIVFVSRMIDKFLSAISLGGINKLFGAFFGGAKVLIIVSIVFYFVNVIDRKINFIDEEKKTNSVLYKPLVGFIDNLLQKSEIEDLKEKIPDDIKKKIPDDIKKKAPEKIDEKVSETKV